MLNRKSLWSAPLALGLLAATASAQLQHGLIDVVENDGGNDPTSVTVTRAGGQGAWSIMDVDCNRADYSIDFATGDDLFYGIPIVGPYDDVRTEPSVTDIEGNPIPYVATVSTARDTGDNHWWFAVHHSSGGYEVNYNVAFAYFPVTDWYAAGVYNPANNEPYDTIVGHPDLVLTDVNDPDLATYSHAVIHFVGTGQSGVWLDEFDMRREGVMLACGGKNEDNYAAVGLYYEPTLDRVLGVFEVRDNGDNGGGYEQDPGAFVFIPVGTTDVTMGRVTGSANVLTAQGDFNVELVGLPTPSGEMRLTIADEDPTTGTLLVSPHTAFGGGTVDNPIFVEPDGDGWIISSRDIGGMGLQTLSSYDIVFNFAFFPNDGTFTPGTGVPNLEDRLDDIVSARFETTELDPGNSLGDMYCERAMGSDALDIAGDNRGDIGVSWLGARTISRIDNGYDYVDGVFLGNPTEFLRQNIEIAGWPIVSIDNGEVRLHQPDDPSEAEINANFALALIPASLGFQQDADAQVLPVDPENPVEDDAKTTVTIDGGRADGVCLAINWDNNNRVVSTIPNGTDSYLLECWNAGDGTPVVDEFGWDYGYVYLPYSTPDLIAGEIDADGTVISGTGNFTAGTAVEDTWGYEVITIEIPGVDANTDGVIVLTGRGGPYAMSWEASADGKFEVAGRDCDTLYEGRVPFSFAYIPYDWELDEPEGLPGDLNCDGVVDFGDINPFVAALGGQASYEAAYPNCDWFNADVNEDGSVDFDDINPFVAVLSS